MEAIELRPLTLGELLDRAFALYRRHFWLFVGIMALPSAVSVPLSVLVFSSQGAAKRSPGTSVTFDILLLAFLIGSWIVYPMAVGASTFAVSESYLGRTSTVRGAYGRVRRKIAGIMGAMAVAGLRVAGVVLLLALGAGIFFAGAGFVVASLARQSQVLAGVIMAAAFVVCLVGFLLAGVWALRYAVCIPALLLENLEALASLRRSVQLTEGRRWQMFVALVISTMIAYVGVLVFQGPFLVTAMLSGRPGQTPPWWGFAYGVSGAVGGAITGPVLIIVLVLLYYDARIRKEAFDLQFMMSSLDQPAPAQGAPSPA